MHKQLKDAIAAAERAKAETRRVADAVEVHEAKLEGLQAGLAVAPDRSGELSEALAGLALGEATAADVAKLRKAIEAEQAAADKRNAADHQRIVEIEQQLNGLRVRHERAVENERQARVDLRRAAVSAIESRMLADSGKLLEHFKAISKLMPSVLSDCMMLDQMDGDDRFKIAVNHVSINLAGWPAFLGGKATDAEVYACTDHGANRATHARFIESINELSQIGVELRS